MTDERARELLAELEAEPPPTSIRLDEMSREFAADGRFPGVGFDLWSCAWLQVFEGIVKRLPPLVRDASIPDR